MLYKIYLILGLFFFTLSISINAQNIDSNKIQFGKGITLRYGIGSLALRDELISKEKYTGTSPVYFVSWSRYNKNFGLNIYLKWEDASSIKNYNVTSNVSQSLLGIAFYYPIGSISIFRKNLFFFLGPAAEMFQHNQTQDISNYSAYNANAFASLFSVCISSKAFYVINSTFMLDACAQLSLLSVANKTTASLSGGTSPGRTVLTPIYGYNSHFEINIRYSITNHIITSAGYRFDLAEITEWDFFITADDEFSAGVSYNF